MLSWKPEDILAICENEADIEALAAAGYKAMLTPAPKTSVPCPRPSTTSSWPTARPKRIARSSGRPIKQWRISVNDLAGYQDLTHVAEKGGVELVRSIIRKSGRCTTPKSTPSPTCTSPRASRVQHGLEVPRPECALDLSRVRCVLRPLRRR